jgi:hypothetical protein
MRAAGELVQDDRSRLRDEQVARRIARREDLHVPRPGRIADVDRVEQHARVDRPRRHLRTHPAQAVGPDRREVDRLLRRKLVEQRQLGQVRPLSVPVELHPSDARCTVDLSRAVSAAGARI